MSQPAAAPIMNKEVAPFANLPSMNNLFFQAKARKGLSFEAIAKHLGKDEVWVAAAFYGQAKFTEEELKKLSDLLGVSSSSAVAQIGDNWFPYRGTLVEFPPRDPVIYRLFEGISVYGTAIKAIINEKFGDGIMSLIDCKVTIDKKENPKGDRVILTFDGKFLPYAKW
ncbi:cyanate lyase C-terminal domain-containing protein [Crepidotus variabilis]|uniref:Cyanate hydratase n=1 Tax=Crepidotus variabilis TaxID=179855 RepID=A0A9P6JUC6_9AGAR|nr:cyanate lyase C-terminal domain-containing protein [Crepidotus variabilis]